jgi:hypothetical protein
MRRLSISDILIAIAAVALGMLILRAYLPGHANRLRYLFTGSGDPTGLSRCHEWAYGPVSCLVVPLMAAVIVMRLRRPRPRRGRLVDQPGLVACVAVIASLIPGLIWIATICHRPGFQRAGGFQQVWYIAIRWADSAVLGSWLALAMSRRWRPEQSWIDRTGRALGLYWILLLFTVLAIPCLERIQRLLALGGLT